MATPNSNRCNEHLVANIIKSHGYPVEVHDEVRTEDDYILTLYRIPHGKVNKDNINKSNVLIMHGLLCSSLDFVSTGPERGLGFILSDRGYDVWIASYRGTTMCQNHLKFDSDKDQQYWQFSVHELGYYDLAAILNHIENITARRTLTYIGYSMGTLLPYVLLSERPEYNKRFNLVIAISPVAILDSIRCIPYKLSLVTRSVWSVPVKKFGLKFPPKWFIYYKSLFSQRCTRLFNVLALLYARSVNGRGSQQLMEDDMVVFLRDHMDTTSVIVLDHLTEMYWTVEGSAFVIFQEVFYPTGKFSKPNYGVQRNFEEYGTSQPPAYDLNKVVCPVVILSSVGDLVSDYMDVRAHRSQLPNCIAHHELEQPTFGHLDFIFGTYAPTVVYPIIVDHLQEHNRAE